MDIHDAVYGRSDPKAAADLPTDVPTVDGTGPAATAGFPADGPAIVEHLCRPL